MVSFLKKELYRVTTCLKNINKLTLLKNVFLVATIVLIIMTSGYSATEFAFSNRFVAVLYLSLFICSLCTFLFFVPFRGINKDSFKSLFKKGRTIKNVLVAGTGLLFIIVIAITSLKDNNFNGAVRFLLITLSSILIVMTVPFKKFCRVFCWSMLAVCLISIATLIVALIIKQSGTTSSFFTGKDSLVMNYGYFSFFLSSFAEGEIRLCGPFWEPSIFAALIIIAMIVLILSDIKKKWPLFTIFFISLILTFSTGGFVMMLFVGLIILSEWIKDTKKRVITVSIVGAFLIGLIVLCFGPLLPFLVEKLPLIFGKFRNGLFPNIRFSSLSILMKVYIKSPIFGFGLNGARLQYLALLNTTGDTSITSTTGMMAASFGTIGLIIAACCFILPVLNEKYNDTTLIVLSLALFVLVNLENMIMISAVILFIVYLNKEGLYGETCLQTYSVGRTKLVDVALNKKESGKTNKNLLGLLFIKGLSLVVGLFAIPVYNTYFITNESYGIWSVIISILTWTLLLDFGFGSGMRAKLADAIENNDKEAEKKIISSTYVGSTAASLIVLAIFETLILTLDLNTLLNIPTRLVSADTLRISMSILAVGLALEFVLKNITFINYSEKRTIVGSSYTLISNVLLILLFVIFANSFDDNKLIAASIIYVLSVNVPFIIGSIIHFTKKSTRYRLPTLSNFDFSTCKSVMSFGMMFFLIQVGFMLIARTDSLFISYYYGPTSAGDYSKYYRIFSFFIGLMAAVVQQPIWSAIASSVNKGKPEDVKKYTFMTLGISLGLFFMCLLSGVALQFIFDIWLADNSITVLWPLVLSFLIYSFVFLIADALIIISNGMKILLPQAIITLITGTAKIVFVIFMKDIPSLLAYGWGIFLIMDAVCYLPFIVVLPLSIRKKVKLLKKEEKTI